MVCGAAAAEAATRTALTKMSWSSSGTPWAAAAMTTACLFCASASLSSFGWTSSTQPSLPCNSSCFAELFLIS